jgi:1-acyl-sn-glycerol-3-phosphate acyltransferase
VIKIIDLLMNLVVILWAVIEITRGGPISMFWGFLLYRSILNITPFLILMVKNYTSPATNESVHDGIRFSQNTFNVQWNKEINEPCIYLANHALWCLDDFIALGALASKRLSIVMNAGPSGLKAIPNQCRDYLCIINRKEGERGSGFKVMEEMINTEIIERGKSLLIFPEDMKRKTEVDKLAPLRSGVIALSKKYNIPIVPIWIQWPCRFPTILNSCEKTIVIKEGKKIIPQGFDSVDLLKNTIHKTLSEMSTTKNTFIEDHTRT